MSPECRHRWMKKQKKPGRFPGRAFSPSTLVARGSFGSAADFDVAEAPAVAVPEAFANEMAGRGRRVFHIDRAAVSRAARGDRATDDCAADQAGRYARGNPALCACGRRGERSRKRCNRDQGSKCLLHVFGSPGVAPSPAPGLGTLSFEPVLAGSAPGSIQNERIRLLSRKSGFFSAAKEECPGKQSVFRGDISDLMKVNGT